MTRAPYCEYGTSFLRVPFSNAIALALALLGPLVGTGVVARQIVTDPGRLLEFSAFRVPSPVPQHP